MRTHVVEMMVNTIEKMAEDSGLSEDEYMLTLAFSMATLMGRKRSNMMNIDMNDLTLVVGLRKNTSDNPPVSQDSASVH